MNSLAGARAGSISMITNNRSSAPQQRVHFPSSVKPSVIQQRTIQASRTSRHFSVSNTVRVHCSSSDCGNSKHGHSNRHSSSQGSKCSTSSEKPGSSPLKLLERVGESNALSLSLSLAVAAAWLCLPQEAQAMTVTPEPSNALSLPTWAIHVSSVLEWVIATKVSATQTQSDLICACRACHFDPFTAVFVSVPFRFLCPCMPLM